MPTLLVLASPIMMIFMMRGMNHGSHGESCHEQHHPVSQRDDASPAAD
jgi:hypothetical protein